jgi:hypothetical protein
MRKVVQEKFPKEIDALILEKDPEATRGSQGYIKLLHHSVSEFIKGLSKEEQQEYEDIAKKRNEEGVDPEIKAQWVQSFFCHLIYMLTLRPLIQQC